MNPFKRLGIIVAPLAFVAVMLLININSYFADKNKINSLFLIVGILFSLVAIWQLIIVIKDSN